MSEQIEASGDDNVLEAKTAQKRVHEEDENSETTEPSNKLMKLPQKRYYRQRAHVNPLSFNVHESHYRPESPESMDWKSYFGPLFKDGDIVKNVDVGCGYGGLLFKLSKTYPNEFSMGMEIRDKVSNFVKEKIKALRHNEPGDWDNICCIRTNAMLYLPNFFAKGQLERMFFLYPDPHFKKSKVKWRIISMPLISMYAYLIKPGGLIYTVTDVIQYHEWVLENFAATKLFTRVDEEEAKNDPIFAHIFESSEEGQKVTRNDGDKFHAIYRRTDVESTFEPNLKEPELLLHPDFNRKSEDAVGDEESENEEDNEEEGTEEKKQDE